MKDSKAKAAKSVSKGEPKAETAKGAPAAKTARAVAITSKNLAKFLGVRRFQYGQAEEKDEVGLVTGYKALGGAPVPLLLPLATIEGKRSAVDLTCIPAFGGASAVCAAQFRFKFD